MYGRISDLGMTPYAPRVELALRTPGLGFHTVRGGIDPGHHGFRLLFVGVVDILKDPGMGPYPPRMEMALRKTGWVFHTMRGGIDPGNHCVRPRFVGVVYVWKD